MYGNGYSMAIVLDHRSTATSLTGNLGYNAWNMENRSPLYNFDLRNYGKGLWFSMFPASQCKKNTF